jgi:MoxR-like ATPase
MVKAYAFISGRDYAVPEDVLAVFKDVCSHRIIISPKAKIAGMQSDEILDNLLIKVAMPEQQV